MTALHLNTGGGLHVRRDTLLGCPVCKIEDAPVVRYVAGSPYYGDRFTCTCCGDSWSEGELAERPFLRAWRQEAIRKAVADWEAACDCKVERDAELYALPCEHETRTA